MDNKLISIAKQKCYYIEIKLFQIAKLKSYFKRKQHFPMAKQKRYYIVVPHKATFPVYAYA